MVKWLWRLTQTTCRLKYDEEDSIDPFLRDKTIASYRMASDVEQTFDKNLITINSIPIIMKLWNKNKTSI